MSSFFARARRKRELDEEIRAHFEMAVRDRMARGESRRDAERAARLEFGNVDNVREDARAAWGGMWMDRFGRDIRFALRALRKRPAFSLSTILILALGIGATTAIFSVVNGVLIQPLPYPESDRLIELQHQNGGNDDIAASTALYFTYREHNQTFDSLALWTSGTAVVTGAQQSEEVQSLDVTHEFLPTLGVGPALGRGFSEVDGQPGAPLTVVVSAAYWERRLGGAEDAIGQSLVIEGEPYTIIGVLPASFRFVTEQVEILTPMQPAPGVGGTAMFGSFGERGIARLKPGVTLAEASADVARMVPIARETFPPFGGDARDDLNDFGPNLQPLKARVVGDLDDVLWILMGTIGLLLLIACANVANLQLMRTDARLEELSIRAALGARFGAIARSLLAETVLLGVVGGAAGLLVATLGLPLLLSAAGEYLPSVLEISIDGTVLVFTLVVSLLSGLVLGFLPLMKHGLPGLTATLRAGGRAFSQSRERHRARNLLVISQVALALVLLVAAGLMMRTFQSLRSIDPGFDPSPQVQTVTIPTGSVPDFARAVRSLSDIQGGLSQLPGVESVGFASMVPLGGIGPNTGAFIEDEPGAERLVGNFELRFVSPELFETVGTPRVTGRDVSWTDVYDADRPEAAMVSESFAQRQFGSPEAALGKRMRRTPEGRWIEIVGVVGDIHLEGVDRPAPDTVYFTLRNEVAQYVSRAVTFVVRSQRVGTPGFLDELQRAVWSVDSSLPLTGVHTLNELYRRSMARTSLTLVLLAIMSTMALGLSLVGIYGVIGYLLSKRTREMGVRIALGAHYAGLKRLLLGQVLAPVVVGVLLGLGLAAALARAAQSLLFGVTALDPATYAVVAMTLVATAAVSGYLPARRVMRVDPTEALRVE